MKDFSALGEFIGRFQYRADRRDRWTLIVAPPHAGDCEDFALTAAYLLAGGWGRFWWGVVSFRFVFWMVWARGDRAAPHVALWVRGAGWIDNIHPWFGARMHPLRWPIPAPLLAVLMWRG